MKNYNSDIILYSTNEGKIRVEVYYEDETFWLSQKRIAGLFDVEVHTINYHIKEIFKSSELSESSTIRKFRIVQRSKKTRIETSSKEGRVKRDEGII